MCCSTSRDRAPPVQGNRQYRRPVLSAAFLVVIVSLVVAGAREPAPLSPADQMYQIASGLRCPVCRNLSVADSPSPLAEEMRAAIADRLKAGETPDEIRAYFADRYGEWILLNPRARGLGWLIWAGPPLALGLGALAVWRLIKTRHPASSTPVSDSERVRIQRELALLQDYE